MGTIMWSLPSEGGSYYFSQLQATPSGPCLPSQIIEAANAAHDAAKGSLLPPPDNIPNLLVIEIASFTLSAPNSTGLSHTRQRIAGRNNSIQP